MCVVHASIAAPHMRNRSMSGAERPTPARRATPPKPHPIGRDDNKTARPPASQMRSTAPTRAQ
eukprot:13367550-Alexandrium_andersonii.AAC.1